MNRKVYIVSLYQPDYEERVAAFLTLEEAKAFQDMLNAYVAQRPVYRGKSPPNQIIGPNPEWAAHCEQMFAWEDAHPLEDKDWVPAMGTHYRAERYDLESLPCLSPNDADRNTQDSEGQS